MCFIIIIIYFLSFLLQLYLKIYCWFSFTVKLVVCLVILPRISVVWLKNTSLGGEWMTMWVSLFSVWQAESQLICQHHLKPPHCSLNCGHINVPHGGGGGALPFWSDSLQDQSRCGVLGNAGTGWELPSADPFPTAHSLSGRSPAQTQQCNHNTTLWCKKHEYTYNTKVS